MKFTAHATIISSINDHQYTAHFLHFTHQPKQKKSNASPMRAALMCRVSHDVLEGASLVLYHIPMGTEIT